MNYSDIPVRAFLVATVLCDTEALHTDLSLLYGHRLSTGGDLLIDAGQEVLGDAEGVLQQGIVWVAAGRVLQQVLQHSL